jgi:aldehyde:ferredoxin oxidoreductase
MADHGESIRCAAALDDYGMDFFEFFSLMVLVKDLRAAGIIPRELVDPDVDLTSRPSMESWAGKISRREGLGDVLAGGLAGALKAFGPEAAPHAPPVVKGLRPYVGPGAALAWNLMGTMELGQLLDPRGPHVGASGSPTYFAKRPLEVFPQHLARMGVPEEAVPRLLSAGRLSVGRLLKHSHRWFTILGSVGVCARAQINRFYNAGRCLAFYRAVTGLETDMDGLRTAADRAWTLLRVINLREGLTREADSPPREWFRGAGFKDYLTDEPVTREMLDRMIDDYYDEQGWDRESGIPTRERLEELGIVKRES